MIPSVYQSELATEARTLDLLVPTPVAGLTPGPGAHAAAQPRPQRPQLLHGQEALLSQCIRIRHKFNTRRALLLYITPGHGPDRLHLALSSQPPLKNAQDLFE